MYGKTNIDKKIRDEWIIPFIEAANEYGISKDFLARITALGYAILTLGECLGKIISGNHSFSVLIITLVFLATSTYIYKRTIATSGSKNAHKFIEMIEFPFRILVLGLIIVSEILTITVLIFSQYINIDAADYGILAVYLNMQIVASPQPPKRSTSRLTFKSL